MRDRLSSRTLTRSEILGAKLDQGRRVEGNWRPSRPGWHVRRWWRLGRTGGLDDEWNANSYEDGALFAGERRRPLIQDDRVASLAARWAAPGLAVLGSAQASLLPRGGRGTGWPSVACLAGSQTSTSACSWS